MVISSYQAAVEELRQRGIVLRQLPGFYIVNFRNGNTTTEYRTDELAGALAHGRGMPAAPPTNAPLGPMGGKPMSRRAKMYRHNRIIAACRQRQSICHSGGDDEPPAPPEADA